jgi:hypothetical protein
VLCFDDSVDNIEAGMAELEALEESNAGPGGAAQIEAAEAEAANPMADPAMAGLMQMLQDPTITVDGSKETIVFGPDGALGTVDITFMESGVLKEMQASCPSTGVGLEVEVTDYKSPAPMPDTTEFNGDCGDLPVLTMAQIVEMVKSQGRRLDEAALRDDLTLHTAHAMRHAHKFLHDYKEAKASATFWYAVRRAVEVLVLLFLSVVVVRGMKRYLGKAPSVTDEEDGSRLLECEE